MIGLGTIINTAAILAGGLLGGLFGLQMAAWSKGPGNYTKPLRVCQIASFAVLVLACVILYIILPYVNG